MEASSVVAEEDEDDLVILWTVVVGFVKAVTPHINAAK